MNDRKEELVNIILYSMIDKLNKDQIEELKYCLRASFYDYDINKLLKTTEYNSIPDHPAGHFNLVNKDTRYFLGFEDKDLDDFLASAGLTKDSFMCSLELE